MLWQTLCFYLFLATAIATPPRMGGKYANNWAFQRLNGLVDKAIDMRKERQMSNVLQQQQQPPLEATGHDLMNSKSSSSKSQTPLPRPQEPLTLEEELRLPRLAFYQRMRYKMLGSHFSASDSGSDASREEKPKERLARLTRNKVKKFYQEPGLLTKAGDSGQGDSDQHNSPEAHVLTPKGTEYLQNLAGHWPLDLARQSRWDEVKDPAHMAAVSLWHRHAPLHAQPPRSPPDELYQKALGKTNSESKYMGAGAAELHHLPSGPEDVLQLAQDARKSSIQSIRTPSELSSPSDFTAIEKRRYRHEK